MEAGWGRARPLWGLPGGANLIERLNGEPQGSLEIAPGGRKNDWNPFTGSLYAFTGRNTGLCLSPN